ncbi:MAG: glycosyltransferase family 39 protein, partial [Anaerolineae bacterium]
MLLFLLILAAILRFWQLGKLPPGLYRDEAFNGLDALRVLNGQHAIFFPANNGREPAYIYLTALFVGLLGRSALAVRLGAAVTGTLTTLLVYKLAQTWYGRIPAFFAAFTWAVTLWPIHLSRIGLRPILLAPLLAATLWLGTLAYRQQKSWLWLLAGLVYGAAYYTYLAVRFTPVLLLALAVYLMWRGRWRRLWPGVVWFGLGTAVALTPFAILTLQQPDILLGRTGQVSILNTAVNGGHLWSTLWQQTGRALGMFLWRGDTILRHNPAGRPVFDWFMALPFLVGLGWCVKNWRRPAAMALLLWTAVMLGPTILAADTPHFLRASGLLPGVVILPAIGLAQIWQWPRLPQRGRQAAAIFLAAG